MFCPKCGTQLPDDAAFCSTCGSSFAPQPIQQPIQQPVLQPVTPAKSKKPLIITLIIVGVIVALFGTFLILEATGVTDVTGWFDSTPAATEEDDDEDKDKDEEEDDKDSKKNNQDSDDNVAVDGDTDDETVVGESTGNEHRYDRYSETRYSDDDGESEFKYTEDTYGYGYSSSDADKVAAYVVPYAGMNMGNDYVDVWVTSEGTAVVYVCNLTYAATDEQKAELLNNAETFNGQSLLSSIQAEEPAVTSLIYRYYDVDGTLLTSMEY